MKPSDFAPEHTPDRIGSTCWYEARPYKGYERGTLRAWATDSLFNDGPNAVGIVEDNVTQFCFTVDAHKICFAEEKPPV